MKHTPEPWFTANNTFTGTEVFKKPYGLQPIANFFKDEDAKRAVICVNACEGIENPESLNKSIVAFEYALHQLSEIYKWEQVGDCYRTPKKYLRKAIDPEGNDTNQDVYGYFEVNFITGEHGYKEEII